MKQILMLLITCVLTSLVYPIYHLASVNEPRELKTVRVGYFYLDGYHLMDEESGALSGYGYDILQHMSGYTNWTYEYVGYDKSWSDMQDMLERGEIDLLTSARKTKDREDRFAFSDNPIGISSGILTVKAGNTSFYADDYENWNGIRVGMLHNNSRNDNFVKFASDHNFTYSIVYYDSLNDIENALAEGSEIDAIVTSNLRILHNEWILAQFDQSPFYIIVNKNNTELLNEINQIGRAHV